MNVLNKRNLLMAMCGLLLLLLSCVNSVEPDRLEFILHPDKQLEISEMQLPDSTTYLEYRLVDGDGVVFEYHYLDPGEPNVTDTGYAERLLWQISNGVTRFELVDSALTGARCIYRRSCFCPDTQPLYVSQGRLSGAIRNGIWFIQGDVTVDLPHQNTPHGLQFFGDFQEER